MLAAPSVGGVPYTFLVDVSARWARRGPFRRRALRGRGHRRDGDRGLPVRSTTRFLRGGDRRRGRCADRTVVPDRAPAGSLGGTRRGARPPRRRSVRHERVSLAGPTAPSLSGRRSPPSARSRCRPSTTCAPRWPRARRGGPRWARRGGGTVARRRGAARRPRALRRAPPGSWSRCPGSTSRALERSPRRACPTCRSTRGSRSASRSGRATSPSRCTTWSVTQRSPPTSHWAHEGGVRRRASPSPSSSPTSRGVTPWVLAELARRGMRQRRVGSVDAGATRWTEEWESQPSVVHAAFDEATHRGLAVGSRRLQVRRSSLVVSLFEQALAAHHLAPAHDVRTVAVDGRAISGRGWPCEATSRRACRCALRGWIRWASSVSSRAPGDVARPLAFLVHGALSSLRPGSPAAGFGLGERRFAAAGLLDHRAVGRHDAAAVDRSSALPGRGSRAASRQLRRGVRRGETFPRQAARSTTTPRTCPRAGSARCSRPSGSSPGPRRGRRPLRCAAPSPDPKPT